jgi:hypothetical protein
MAEQKIELKPLLVDDPEIREKFFDSLRQSQREVVPVVGSGLSRAAGAPTFDQLDDGLRAAATSAGASSDVKLTRFELADALETELGADWLQRAVSEIVANSPLNPTPELMILSKVPSNLLLTTNYDLGIEISASKAGLKAISVPIGRANEAVDLEPGTIGVIHLHGLSDEPSSIVLGTESYNAITSDDRVQLILRSLATRFDLLFLGFSFGDREEHFARELEWALSAFEKVRGHQFLLRSEEASEDLIQKLIALGVQPVVYGDAASEHQFVRTSLRVLGPGSTFDSHEYLPRLTQSLDAHYTPVPQAPWEDMKTEQSRQVWGATTGLLDRPRTTILDVEVSSGLVVIGDPGSGKTQAGLALGESSRYPAVFLKLTAGIGLDQGSWEPIHSFLAWTSNGFGLEANCPRPTAETVESGVFTFVLDGFDEIPAPHRERVAQIIVTLRRKYPQHQWIVTSRYVPQLDAIVTVMPAIYLWPDPEWLVQYAESRGFNQVELENLLDSYPGSADLIEVPIFAAAAFGMVERGESIPQSILGLLVSLADVQLSVKETELGAPPDHAKRWLNRLALTMELRAKNETDLAEIESGNLHEGLEIVPEPATLDRLIARTLLLDVGPRVLFPRRLIQEARAANTVLLCSNPLEVLKLGVVAEVGGSSFLRPSWANSIDLLLSEAPADVRSFLNEVDPRAAARAVQPADSGESRTAAVGAIYDFHKTSRFWFPKDGLGSRVLSDRDVVLRLLKNGLKEDFLSELRDDCSDEIPVIRGNAIQFLTLANDVEWLRDNLSSLVKDSDAVVRRIAASSAHALGITEVADDLVEQLRAESDELAIGAVGSAALALAEPAVILEILQSVPQQFRFRVYPALDERLSAPEQLKALSLLTELDEDWLEHLLKRKPSLSDPDIEVLIELAMSEETHMLLNRRDVQTALESRPHTALQKGLSLAREAIDVHELYFLLQRVPAEEVQAMVGSAEEVIRSTVEAFLAATAVPAARRVQVPQQNKVELADLLDPTSKGELFSHRWSKGDALSLSEEQRSLLETRVGELRSEIEDKGAIWMQIHKDEATWYLDDPRILTLMEFMGALDFEIEEEFWFGLVTVAFPSGAQEWLSRHFDSSWEDRLIRMVGSMDEAQLRFTIRSLPEEWSENLAEEVAKAAYKTSDPEVRRLAAERLATNLQKDVLWALYQKHADDSLLSALVRAGDCSAEDLLLKQLMKDPEPPSFNRGEAEWMRSVRCRESGPLVAKVVECFLEAGISIDELEPLVAAFNRTNSEEGLAIWGRMSTNSKIPQAWFLRYQGQRLADEIAESKCMDAVGSTFAETAALVVDETPISK